jgi:dolichol-phosphate mannosyltransferase
MIPVLDNLVDHEWEMIVVDDGSSDGTLGLIRGLSRVDARVRGVALSRNFGHQPALDAGLAFASGECIAVVDCDLQDPPDVLAHLVRRVRNEGYDVCYAVRRRREGPLILRVLYRIFYRLIRNIAEHPWPLDAGDFSAFNRRTLHALLALPENIRMLRGLRAWVGLRQAAVAYDRPPRAAGRSKYNLARLTSLAIRAFVGFSYLPLRIASMIGLVTALLSALVAGFFVLNRMIPGITPFGYYVGANPGTTTIVVLFLLMNSILFLCLGIIGEYVAVITREIKGRPAAIVRETIGSPALQSHRFPILLLGDAKRLE